MSETSQGIQTRQYTDSVLDQFHEWQGEKKEVEMVIE